MCFILSIITGQVPISNPIYRFFFCPFLPPVTFVLTVLPTELALLVCLLPLKLALCLFYH